MSENTVASVAAPAVASIPSAAVATTAAASVPASAPVAVDSFLDEYVMEQVTIRSATLAEKSQLPPDMQDDIQQQMLMALLRARKRFDPTKAGSHTFASRVMDGFCKDFIRHQVSKREQEFFDVPCTDVGKDFSLDHCPVGEGILDELVHDETTVRVRRVLDTLPDDLRRICDAILLSKGVRGGYHRLGTSRKIFYRRISRLQRRFREAGVAI